MCPQPNLSLDLDHDKFHRSLLKDLVHLPVAEGPDDLLLD